LGLSGRVPHRVDAATKTALLGLLDDAIDAGWTLRRACHELELDDVGQSNADLYRELRNTSAYGAASGDRRSSGPLIQRSDGRRAWTIVWPEGTEHAEAHRFLRRHEGSGTQRTYA
jgi:hypothetical protein